MFGSLVERARATVDDAIGSAVNRVVVAIPVLVAAGFLTAAAAELAYRELGTLYGNLALGAGFLLLGGLVAAVILPVRPSPDSLFADAADVDDASKASDETKATLSTADRELLASAATALAPFALPRLLPVLLRNLPLLIVIAVAAFILTRSTVGSEGESGSESEQSS